MLVRILKVGSWIYLININNNNYKEHLSVFTLKIADVNTANRLKYLNSAFFVLPRSKFTQSGFTVYKALSINYHPILCYTILVNFIPTN